MTPELSREAMRQLDQLGVEVRVNTKVSEINEIGIRAGNDFIETETILWAAGVAANPLNKTLDSELDRQGRVIVTSNLSIPNYSNIFVIGDQAHYKWGTNNMPLPGLAPVAMQQGRFVAKVIKKIAARQVPPTIFQYVDKGQMATIGKRKAITEYKSLRLHGFIAWLAWFFIHILYLVGFKNKLFVFTQWVWSYLFSKRGARLITERGWKLK